LWCFSVSDDKAVKAARTGVLVSNEAVAAFRHGLALDVQQRAQVTEQLHLAAVVLRIVLDVALVRTKIFH